MTVSDSARIADRVVSKAEDLEEIDSIDDIDPLEVYFEVSSDGTVREVIAILCTGGPHIEVRLFSGVVDGSWGDTHSVPVIENEETLQEIGNHYARTFEECVIA